MKKPQEPEIDLDSIYGRLAENEAFYYDEIGLWEKLDRSALYLLFIAIATIIVSISLLPENIPLLELFPDYPLQVSLVLIGLGLLFFALIAKGLGDSKISKIRDELGLHREERLFLRVYETYMNIDSYLNESNLKRRPFLRRLALESAETMINIVGGWNYGNIKLIRNLIGDQIDLFKDNMKRLVLSNVAKGDERELRKISEMLIEFCKHIHSPSIENLDKLNNSIKELPFKKYEVLTRKRKMSKYLYGRPRALRLLFASITTIIIAVVLVFLGQNVGLIFAVCATCFWGALSQFDKIFRIKEKEEVERVTGRLRAYVTRPKTPKEDEEGEKS